jgi:N-acetyl-beta-hexosaminidase
LELTAAADGDRLLVNVPLKRGCAMLLLTHTWMLPRAAAFHDTVIVELGTRLERVDLRYTLDGSEPTARSPLYTARIGLKQTTVVKAATFRGDQKIGRTLEREYVKLPALPTPRINWENTP